MRYAQIREMDISNGEGVGIALFVQGCPFHCHNCFNPDTWDFNGGKEWTKESEDKIIELARRPYIKRITILGGEPLANKNVDGVYQLINRFRSTCPDKTIWLYTGYTLKLSPLSYVDASDDYKIKQSYNFYTTQPSKEHITNFLRSAIIEKVDVVVDGQYIDEQGDITLKWRGSLNQRVIDVKKSLEQQEIVLYCD